MKGLIIMLGCFILLPLSADRRITYREDSAGEVEYRELEICDSQDGPMVITTEEDKQLLIQLNEDLHTQELTILEDGEITTLVRWRDTIRVEGSGEVIEIDEDPWFESDYCFSSFVLSEERKQQFWVVDSEDGFDAFKCEMKRVGDEVLNVDGRDEQVVHFTMSMPIIPDFIWHADFWGRRSDGLILAWEMPLLGSGNAKMVITMVEEQIID